MANHHLHPWLQKLLKTGNHSRTHRDLLFLGQRFFLKRSQSTFIAVGGLNCVDKLTEQWMPLWPRIMQAWPRVFHPWKTSLKVVRRLFTSTFNRQSPYDQISMEKALVKQCFSAFCMLCIEHFLRELSSLAHEIYNTTKFVHLRLGVKKESMKKFISIFPLGIHALKAITTLKNICSLHLLLDFLVKLEHMCQISSVMSDSLPPHGL